MKVVINPGHTVEVGEKSGDKVVTKKYGPGDEVDLKAADAKKLIARNVAKTPAEAKKAAEETTPQS